MRVKLQSQQLEQLRHELRDANRRSFHGSVAAALIVSATMVIALDGLHPRMLAGIPLATWVLGALGGAILVSVWPRNR